MELNLDLHIHTSSSFDSRLTLEEIVNQAKLKGLDGIAICDHDRFLSTEIDYSGFLIIPGVEYSTEYGDLLGLFVSNPRKHTTFEEDVDYIHSQGGLAVLPHPYMRSSKLAVPQELLEKLDAVETWNARAERKLFDANKRASKLADRLGVGKVGGSDAHLLEEIGNGITTVETESLDPEAVKQGILDKKCKVTGVRSPAMSIAKSNRIKIVRLRLGLKTKIKWGFFAAGCFIEDLTIKHG